MKSVILMKKASPVWKGFYVLVRVNFPQYGQRHRYEFGSPVNTSLSYLSCLWQFAQDGGSFLIGIVTTSSLEFSLYLDFIVSVRTPGIGCCTSDTDTTAVGCLSMCPIRESRTLLANTPDNAV